MQRLYTANIAETAPVKDYSDEEKASPVIRYKFVDSGKRMAFDPLRIVDFVERDHGIVTFYTHDREHSIVMDFEEMLRIVTEAQDADDAAWNAKIEQPEKKAAVVNIYEPRIGDALSDIIKDGLSPLDSTVRKA